MTLHAHSYSPLAFLIVGTTLVMAEIGLAAFGFIIDLWRFL